MEKCIKCFESGLFRTIPNSSTRDCICGALYHPCSQHPHVNVAGPSSGKNICSCDVPLGSCPNCKTEVQYIQQIGNSSLCPRCKSYFHTCERHPANIILGKNPGALTYRDCSCGLEARSRPNGIVAHEAHLLNSLIPRKQDSHIIR